MGNSNTTYSGIVGYTGIQNGLSISSDNILLKSVNSIIDSSAGNIYLQPSGGKIAIGKKFITASYVVDISGAVIISGALNISGNTNIIGTTSISNALTASGGVYTNAVFMGNSNTTYSGIVGYTGIQNGLSISSDNILLNSLNSIIDSSAGNIYLQPSGGRIAIGKKNITSNYTVDISGAVIISGSVLTLNGNNLQIYGPGNGIHLDTDIGRPNPASQILAIDISNGNTNDIIFKTAPVGSIGVYNMNSERMRISNSGTVGIGTNNPSSLYKVDISGSLRINESVGSGGIGSFSSGSIVLQHANNSNGLSSILFNNTQYPTSYGSFTYYDSTSVSQGFPNYNISTATIFAIDLSGNSIANNTLNNMVIRTNGYFIIDTGNRYNTYFINGVTIGKVNSLFNYALDVSGTINTNILSTVNVIVATNGNIFGSSNTSIYGFNINSPSIVSQNINSVNITASNITTSTINISALTAATLSLSSTADNINYVTGGSIYTAGGIGCVGSLTVGGNIFGNIFSNIIRINPLRDNNNNIISYGNLWVQTGSSIYCDNGTTIYGNSIVINPFGKIISNAISITQSNITVNSGSDMFINSTLTAGAVNINNRCIFGSGSTVTIQSTNDTTISGSLVTQGSITANYGLSVTGSALIVGAGLNINGFINPLNCQGQINAQNTTRPYGLIVSSHANIIGNAIIGGSIGIGTSTPAFPLDVSGIINATTYYQGNSPLVASQWITSNPNIYFLTGNVGIGTSTPGFKLDINGIINATNYYLNGNLFTTSQWVNGTNNSITFTAGSVRVGNDLGIGTVSTVNYSQTSTLGFGFAGGSTGTNYRWKIDDITLNRDNGAGPNFDYGAQSKLIFSCKSNNLYGNVLNDQQYLQGLTLVPNSVGNGGLSTGINVGIGITTPTSTLHVIGTITATFFNATSDYRLKKNIQILNKNKTIDLLQPVEYDLSGGKHDMGFLAHEVENIFPFLVDGKKDGDEMQSINYNGFIALLVKEVQDLKRENNSLKEKNNLFENRLQALESIVLHK